MESKLYKWMVLIVIGLLSLAILFPQQKKAYDLHDLSFDVQQNSALFFKNTRASKYVLHEMNDAGFNIYRQEIDPKADTISTLNFSIVHNWRSDEAYIIAEPNALLAGADSLKISSVTDTFFYYRQMDSEAHYHFAASIFEAILEGKDLTFLPGGDNIFGPEKCKKANRRVLEDYFRLVYKYR